MRRSSSDGLNQTVPPPHVLKMTQAHGEEHKLWSQGQILAPLGTDWAWIQVLLPSECGILRLGSPLCFRVFERSGGDSLLDSQKAVAKIDYDSETVWSVC